MCNHNTMHVLYCITEFGNQHVINTAGGLKDNYYKVM